MLDIICTRKEKIRVFLFLAIYKMMLNIFKSERTCGAMCQSIGTALETAIYDPMAVSTPTISIAEMAVVAV